MKGLEGWAGFVRAQRLKRACQAGLRVGTKAHVSEMADDVVLLSTVFTQER